MDLTNLLVEVRNSSLERVGAILSEDLRLDAEIPFNAVGTWTCVIGASHPLAGALAAPGGGLIVTDTESGEVLFSGPTTSPETARSVEDVGGTITVAGVTDDVILDDSLAWPEPANGTIETQALDYDERTGTSEALMHAYVNANIGPSGATGRKNPRLLMGLNRGRGTSITQRTRFDVLLVLLQNVAKPDGLGFRVVQVGSALEFRTYAPADNTRKVRLSIDNYGLTSSRVAQLAPGVTRAIIAGKGGAVTRLFKERANAGSLEAETQWGRRIERFVDQQSTRNVDEMNRAGDEVLAVDGFTGSSALFEPTEDMRHAFGKEWFLGDRVSVEAGNVEYLAPVASVVLKVDSDGLRVGAKVGDPSVFGFASTYGGPVNDSAFDTTAVEQATEDAANASEQATTAAEQAAEALTEAEAAIDIANAVEISTAAAQATATTALTNAATANTAAINAAAAASAAATAAAAANTNATTAQTTANGKNKVTYSTTSPGTTANAVGDLWFRYDVSNVITGQWEGKGGTTWQAKTMGSLVIASVDAGKITAASVFTQNLGIQGTFTLGDSSNTGTIESYNFAAATTGVQINKGGLTAKGGTITGALLQTELTSARGIKIVSTGMNVYDSAGIPTLTITASSGAIAMKGSLTSGSDITGAVITGGVWQTEVTTARGIKVASTGLLAYDLAGNPTFSITASSGAVAMKGDLISGSTITGAIVTGGIIRTSDTGARVELDTNQWGAGVLRMTTGDAGEAHPMSGGTGGTDELQVTGLGPAGLACGALPMTGTTRRFVTELNAPRQSGTLPALKVARVRAITTYNTSSAVTTAKVRVYAPDGADFDGMITTPGEIHGGELWSDAFPTVANAANMWMGGSGRIYKTTSSLRYKENVQPFDLSTETLLALEPVTFTSKGDDSGRRFPGVIAEQAHEAGLGLWVDYNDEGAPDGFGYGTYVIALLAVAKRQQAQIDELNAAVEALQG